MMNINNKVLNDIKKQLGEYYGNFAIGEIIFAYVDMLDIEEDTSLFFENRDLANEYITLLKQSNVDIDKLLQNTVKNIEKIADRLHILSLYSMEVNVLKEAYLYNYNDLQNIDDFNISDTLEVIGEVITDSKDDTRALYNTISYINYIAPIRYTKLKFKDIVKNALRILDAEYFNYDEAEFRFGVHANPYFFFKSDERVDEIESVIQSIKSKISGDDSDIDALYIENFHQDIVQNMIFLEDLVKVMLGVSNYLLVYGDRKLDILKYVYDIEDISEEELDAVANIHFKAYDKLEYCEDLLDYYETKDGEYNYFLKIKVTYSDILNSKVNRVRKYYLERKELESVEALADALVGSCINKGEDKKIRRIRMRALLSELPMVISNMNEFKNIIEVALKNATQQEISYFLSNLYDMLDLDDDEWEDDDF